MFLLITGLILGYLLRIFSPYFVSLSQKLVQNNKQITEGQKINEFREALEMSNEDLNFIDCHAEVISCFISVRDEPHLWKLDEYCIIKNKLQIWHANGIKNRKFWNHEHSKFNKELTHFDKQILDLLCNKVKELQKERNNVINKIYLELNNM